MEKKITIEQLVEQAKQTADFRLKVMNELRASIEKTLIPNVCAVLDAYGVDCLYIKSSNKIITTMSGNNVPDRDREMEREYFYAINNDATISSYYVDYNQNNGEYEWMESNVRSHIKFNECVIPKRLLASFVGITKTALLKLNKEMEEQVELAKLALDNLSE